MSKQKSFGLKRKASVIGMMVAGLVGASAAYAGAPAAVVKAGVPGAGSMIKNGAVLLAWSGDAVALPVPVQMGRDKDFLAVIDNEPYSSTYGKVIWTAELTSLMVGGVPGGVIDSATHNDPHHMLAYESYVDWNTGRKYTWVGGVISKNIFRYDITSVRNIPIADPVVCGTQPTQSSLTDDFFVMPNGNMMVTYMSNFGYTGNETGAGTPLGGGTVSEFFPLRTAKTLINLAGLKVCLPGALGGASEDINSGRDTYLGEYQVSPQTGESANVSRRAPLHADNSPTRQGDNKGFFFLGNTNASKEGLPHGMGLTYDGRYLVAADYSVALSIGAAAANLINNVPGVTTQVSKALTYSTFGAAVRVMRVNPNTLNPVPAYGPKNADGYASPTSNTYNEGAQGQYALDGKPTDDPGAYMQSISVVPDGPRHEQVAFHEEPEGLMPFAIFHQEYHCKHQKGWDAGADGVFGTADDGMGSNNCPVSERIPHNGASVSAMCGGSMYYTANVRLPQSANNGYGPIWHAIYDVGPCAGVSYHAIIDDDRFVVQPIAGIESNTSQDVLVPPVFDRDYPRQHSRRMLTMDFRPLLERGNGISNDANGDGELNEDDLAAGATFSDPITCGFTGEAMRVRKGGVTEINGAVGRGMTNPGDGGPAITPATYVATTGTPYAAPYNILIHNNRADDCPRVLSAVGQFETGTNASEPAPGIPVGQPTTQTGNNGIFPGVGYAQYATAITQIHSDTEVGGAPTLTNINTAQNMNTNGGPHFTHQDRIGFCLPTGSANGIATCKPGSYYDLTPDPLSGSPRTIYPATAADVVKCAQGSTAFKGANGSTAAVDPSCVGRVMFMQYFVELNHVPAPGTGSDGDRTICQILVNRVTGATMMDPLFVDELTKQPCLDFDSKARERKTFGLLGVDTCGTAGNNKPGDYCWPGARGGKGGAKPHAGAFERDGAAMFGPGFFPRLPINPDGNI